MKLLSNFLVYSYNDMSANFIRGLSYNENNFLYRGYHNSNFFSLADIDIIPQYTQILLWKLLDPILTNNIMIVFACILNVFFCLKLFSLISENITLSNSKFLVFVFSITYAFSPYFLFRVISATPALYFTFVFPLLFYLLLKKVNSYYLVLYNVFVFLISVYYGFFVSISVILWLVSAQIFDLFNSNAKKIGIAHFTKKILQFSVPLLLILIILYRGLLVANIGFNPKYIRAERLEWESVKTIYRPVEDFYSFSFRPWYFVIPPKSSLFFGEFSKFVYSRLNETDYYLADDYQDEEMGGSYLGWHLILGSLLCVFLVRKRYSIESKDNIFVYETTHVLLLILVGILLLTGPPSFTISGIKILTPSTLLHHIVPAFRVLVRFASVIFLIFLIINFILIHLVLNVLATKNKYFSVLSGTVFLVLNYLLLGIHLPIINLNSPPEEFEFLKQASPKSEVFMVLPKADYEATFWILYHRNYMYNPRDLINSGTKFDSDKFTKSLMESPEQILEMKSEDIKYVVVYTNKQHKNLEYMLKLIEENYGGPKFTNDAVNIYEL